MTDNTGVSLTRDEAIDRMKAGLPCETLVPHETNWRVTLWSDFSFGGLQFRKPPEPRREAREWVAFIGSDGQPCTWASDKRCFSEMAQANLIHVREVLPDEMPVRRMTWAEANDAFDAASDKSLMTARTAWIESRRALGLIAEDK